MVPVAGGDVLATFERLLEKTLDLRRVSLRVLWRKLNGRLRSLGSSAFVKAPRSLRLKPCILLAARLVLGEHPRCLGRWRIGGCDLVGQWVRLLAHRLGLGRDHDRGRDVLRRLCICLCVILSLLPESLRSLTSGGSSFGFDDKHGKGREIYKCQDKYYSFGKYL